jgi:hypothetical protein
VIRARGWRIVIAMLFVVSSAWAESEHIEVALVGSEDAIRFVEAPLRASLASLPVEVTTSPADTLDVNLLLALPSSTAIARIWVDVRSTERIAMFLADRSGQRILVRQVQRSGAEDAVAREELFQILESSIEALLAGGTIGVEREDARRELGLPEKAEARRTQSRPKPVPPPKAKPKAESGATFFVGYHALLWSQFHPLHGPLVGAEVFGGRFRLSFNIEPRFPRRVEGDVVSMDVFHVGTRLVPWYTFELGEPVVVALGLGAGLDVQRSEAVAVPGSDATLGDPFTTLVPVLRGAVAIDLPELRLRVGLALDVDIVRTEYIVVVDGDRQRAFVPWRLHPVLFAAFTFGP